MSISFLASYQDRAEIFFFPSNLKRLFSRRSLC